MRNSLIFGGIDSASFGIFISGTGTHNAPKRVVEKIAVPGRNGLLIMDQGRYDNIIVEYPAFAYGKTREEFQSKLDSFRNAVASLIGYQRLEDTYRPNEYRMALFCEGLEVEAFAFGRSGQFTLKFECKPQRYLKDGELAMPILSGSKIINPTRHKSSPILAVEGYGKLRIKEQLMQISNVVVGEVLIADAHTYKNIYVEKEWDDKAAVYSEGDKITIKGMSLKSTFKIGNNAVFVEEADEDSRPMGIEYWSSPDQDATLSYQCAGKTVTFGMKIPEIEFTVGVNKKITYKVRSTVKIELNGHWNRNSVYNTTTIEYKDGKISISADRLFPDGEYLERAKPTVTSTISIGLISGYSTTSTIEGTTYIDCDTGDAYKIEDGQYTQLNSIVSIGADLPVLDPGENEIEYDDTITSLKVIPRWWQI